ncbi:MAG TPA: hypothetical protein VH120_12515 [Gemmataceae bacterium]|jgi:hypothetical protein|nr:hypothetical protein [Gemmataceae bacterium]
MEPESHQSASSEKPSRRSKHRHRHRQRQLRRKAAWKQTLLGLSLIGAALILGGGAIAAALYFTKPPTDTKGGPGNEPQPVAGDPRLVGTWVADIDTTIADLQEKKPLTDPEELDLRRKKRTSILTFTGEALTIQISGKVDTQPYTLAKSDGDTLVLETWFVTTKSKEEVKVRFINRDACWIEVPRFSLLECYRRVKPPGPPPAAQAVPADAGDFPRKDK